MVLQCWCYVGDIEWLKGSDIEWLNVNDIVFCLSVFEMGWHEGLWKCVYKGVEVKRLNGNAKKILCVRERKSLETLKQMKQIVVLKHWIKNVTKSSLETLNQRK